MQATAVTIQDFWPKNDMPSPHINKKGRSRGIFDIYHRSFIIAISPRGNGFKGVISKVPGGNSYFEASMIDIKNSSLPSLTIDVRSMHVVFWPKILYSYCCGRHPVLPFLETKIGDTRDQMEQIGNILLW